jgi:hypothetical protein
VWDLQPIVNDSEAAFRDRGNEKSRAALLLVKKKNRRWATERDRCR